MIFNHDEFEHEKIVFRHDVKSGLKSIIAIHNTSNGPALGGCRMKEYASDEDAIYDVLRLSKGMTYKAAMADIELGGGKAIIIGNSKNKTPELLKAYGEFVNTLDGDYITAEDVGTTVHDMDIIKTKTKHVVGTSDGTGDPSNATAMGCFIGIKAAVEHKMNRSLDGLRFAVQGIGQVGFELCEYLSNAGGTLFVSDINESVLKSAQDRLHAEIVPPDEIYDVVCDVFVPCAMGAVVNRDTLDRFTCHIIAGSANNVLEKEIYGDFLKQKNILYAPDYVINAGGLISASHIVLDVTNEEVNKKVNQIGVTLTEIFEQSERTGVSTNLIANQIAKEKMS